MRSMVIGVSALIGTVMALGACSGGSETAASPSSRAALQKGGEATDYPEAVTLDEEQSVTNVKCSGTLIAPTIVLTSATCVLWHPTYAQGSEMTVRKHWKVKAPYSGLTLPNAVDAEAFSQVPFPQNQYPIALVYLDSPVELSTPYPTLASSAVDDSAQVVTVGRSVGDWRDRLPWSDPRHLSDTDSDQMWVSNPTPVSMWAGGFPMAYSFSERDSTTGETSGEIGSLYQGPDEGGPAFLPGKGPDGSHALVGVDVPLSNRVEGVARVDVPAVREWILRRISERAYNGILPM